MVYYAASLPTVLSELESWGAVWYLLARGIPIIYKMFAIHIVMGTYWIFSMANGPLWLWIYWHPEEVTALKKKCTIRNTDNNVSSIILLNTISTKIVVEYSR